MPEQTIGIYELRRQIGKGGMGAVYLAHDPTLDRPVAIKLLPAELAADPDYLARFQREATSVAKIRHPNLLHIYAVGCDAGRHFIAMEYIKGHTLARIVRRQGPLPYKVALRVLGQVLSALDKIHAAGIVHRDLKSSNIMIDEDRRAILMDFGLAKPRHDRSVTTGHTLLGTPEYMAPELAEGRDATFGSDIYALGVVLHEMLTGHVPFRGSSAIATLRQQVDGPTPSLAGIVPDLPPELDAVLGRMMAKKADERYPTTRAVAADLVTVCRTAALATLARGAAPAAAAPAATPGPDVSRTAPTWTAAGRRAGARRPTWLVPAIAGAGLGAVALAVALTVHLLGRRGDGPAATALHATTSAAPTTGAAPATATATPTTLARSKGRYRVRVLPNSTVAGRLVSIDSEWVRIETDDGTVERIAYGSVLRIEKLGGP